MMATQSEMQVGSLNSSITLSIQSRKINNRLCDTVDARELHAFLEVGRFFSNWIKARIQRYDFVEELDYLLIDDLSLPVLASSKARPQKVKNYFITLDMAKELAMVERNEKGKEARRYFIECEHQLRSNQVPAIEQTATSQALLTSNDFQSALEDQAALQEQAKYQILNGMVKSMNFKEDTVVIPSIELVRMVHAIRAYQDRLAHIAKQTKSPVWIEDQIETIKVYTNRTLAD
jgi:phage anti-repressor protein